MPGRRALAVVATSVLAILLGGCQSHFMQATLVNAGESPLRVVEVDYPNASFGVSTLAPHGVYHYRFKVQSEGELQVTYTDATGQILVRKGPKVSEGDPRRLAITIGTGGNVTWKVTP